jgi:hypothetical protein
VNRYHAGQLRELLQRRHPDAVVTVTAEPDGAQVEIVGRITGDGATGNGTANRVSMSLSEHGVFLRNLIAETAWSYTPGEDSS